ncbi:hypothetical protein BJX70DRAFT_316647 [Aspergillus crustosus]
MKHIRGLLSMTQALRQIFLAPQTLPRSQFFRYVPAHSPLQIRHAWKAAHQQQEQTIDTNIRAEYVQIVNAENKLGPPVTLRDALGSINRPDEFLLQVSAGSYDTPAICRVMTRAIARQQKEVQKVKAAKIAKAAPKTIELNWAIDPHDLSHRLKQLLNFLDKGRTVEIILKRKKGKRDPTVEEVKALMDKVLQVVKDADAIQVDPMEGMPGRQVSLVVKKRNT